MKIENVHLKENLALIKLLPIQSVQSSVIQSEADKKKFEEQTVVRVGEVLSHGHLSTELSTILSLKGEEYKIEKGTFIAFHKNYLEDKFDLPLLKDNGEPYKSNELRLININMIYGIVTPEDSPEYSG